MVLVLKKRQRVQLAENLRNLCQRSLLKNVMSVHPPCHLCPSQRLFEQCSPLVSSGRRPSAGKQTAHKDEVWGQKIPSMSRTKSRVSRPFLLPYPGEAKTKTKRIVKKYCQRIKALNKSLTQQSSGAIPCPEVHFHA